MKRLQATLLATIATTALTSLWIGALPARAECNPLGPFPQSCGESTGFVCVDDNWVCPAIGDTSLQNPLSPAGGNIDPNVLFARVAKGFLAAIGGATIFFVVLGGYIITASAGNAERYAQGKKTVAYALIGFILVIGSYTLLSIALNVITANKGLPAFERFRLTDPLGITSPADLYGGRLAGFFVAGLGAVTVLMLIYGGLQWMIGLKAGKGKEAIFAARTTIVRTLMGVAIVLGAYALVNFAFNPIYNLLTSGNVAVQNPTVPPEPADTQQVACFRLDNGKDFGATCEEELYSTCLKPTATKQRGEVTRLIKEDTGKPYVVSDCSEIGACAQELPGTAYKNRIAASQCQPGSPTGYRIFNPISEALIDGSCPFDGTTALYLPAANPPYNRACYAEIMFFEGADLPIQNEWACVREQKTSTRVCSGGVIPGTPCVYDGQCGVGGRCVERVARTYNYACTEETRNDCGRETATHFPGNYYGQTTCSEVGYCEMSFLGHYDCKNGVVNAMCKPFLFPAVGVPIPPWGCGDYADINGQCYVDRGITWHESGSAGKYCPRRP